MSFNPFAGGELERVVASTPAQREIIASSQISDEANIAFNEAATIALTGPIDAELLTRSFEVLVDRHDSFRSTFSRKGDEICLQNSARGQLEVIDKTDLSDQAQQDYLQQLYADIAHSPMNLEDGPLLFAWFVELNENSSQLVLAAHHAICDGWSFGIIATELAKIYSSGASDQELKPAPSFLDYAEQEHASQVLNQDVDYWKAKFTELPPTLDLPLDYTRPVQRTFVGARYDYVIEGEFAQQLRQAAASMKTSLINVVLSAYGVLLHKLSGNDDIVIGLPVAGQAALNKFELAGHMVQLLPIRMQLDADTKFSDLLAHVKSAVFDASDHPKFTYGELVRDFAIDRSRVPLIATICNVDQKMPTLEFGDAKGETNSIPRAAENFELFLNVVPKDDELIFEASYSTALFKEASIASWMQGLQQILSDIIANADTSIADLALAKVLPAFNEQVNQTAYTCQHDSMISAVEQAATKYAEREALICAQRSMSYQDMWQRASALAAHLLEQGVQEGHVVGVCCERSENLVIATLALHRLGAAYLPLDPSFPLDRLKFVYQDAGAFAAIVDATGQALLEGANAKLLDVNAQADASAITTVANDPARLAYIIYTSGSTGKPKGVEISWGSMINLLESMLVAPGLDASNTFLAVTTLAFDISVVEMFLPIMVGARIVIAEQNDLKDGEALAGLIAKHKVDYLQSTPATFQLLMTSSWAQAADQTMKALCCGEPLPPALAEALVPRLNALWNMYGPTEATVYATRKHIQDTSEIITIGRAIDNTQTYILDSKLNPVPMSVPGELCIAGANLAIAYHGRPDLTATAFVEHPSLGRIYRTGDLAKWNSEHEVVHLGRIDDQVKLRGYRIELGEIEKAIIDTKLVDNVAVILKGESKVELKLVACCQANDVQDSTEAQIKELIRQHLPGYMVPQQFAFIDALPLSGSGKIDRKKLRGMDLAIATRIVEEHGSAPSTDNERYLASLWQELLELDQVYVDDNFFDAGGHSLLAAQMIAQLAKDKGVQLPFNALISSNLAQISTSFLDNKPEDVVKTDITESSKRGWLSSLFGKK